MYLGGVRVAAANSEHTHSLVYVLFSNVSLNPRYSASGQKGQTGVPGVQDEKNPHQAPTVSALKAHTLVDSPCPISMPPWLTSTEPSAYTLREADTAAGAQSNLHSSRHDNRVQW